MFDPAVLGTLLIGLDSIDPARRTGPGTSVVEPSVRRTRFSRIWRATARRIGDGRRLVGSWVTAPRDRTHSSRA
jgi:hypothetical protein